MCLALYIASDQPLRVIAQREYAESDLASSTWPREAQRFHTEALRPNEEPVRSHFRHAHVLYAGSYEGCACGFNFGREYPDSVDAEEDKEKLQVARESVAELIRYVRESEIREIFSCWSGDEAKPTVHQRTVTPEALALPEFSFREQELLTIDLET